MLSWASSSTASATLAPPRKNVSLPSENEATHRKRLAQILRYIAGMHQSSDGVGGCSFVQPVPHPLNIPVSLFFQRENVPNESACGGVLFTTDSFRQLLALAVDDAPPFSFYAAAKARSFLRGQKRTLAGSAKDNVLNEVSDSNPAGCWFRITRMAAQALTPPDASDPDVRAYIEEWLGQVQNLPDLLTYQRLEQAPKVSPAQSTESTMEIKSFLRKYKKYVRKRTYQQQLEPIYNRLFEWVQNQQDNGNELVWGMGHASQLLEDKVTLVNGPVVEVQVEVTLDTDGTILVCPREHTGVSLNRQVVSAIRSSTNDQYVLQNLHRLVANLEVYDVCPGEPQTYIPLLKRVAVQLASDGTFQSSDGPYHLGDDSSKLIVTEAWCLYIRPRPSSMWARDATAFADQLMKPTSSLSDISSNFVVPRATRAFTCGPGGSGEWNETETGSVATGSMRMYHWMQSRLFRRPTSTVSDTKPILPLPSSDAQNRIAELLLSKKLSVVVCEGPPGCGKTQAIANTLCAYLCHGKRVLVTSKNASALSVLRGRLPQAVQDLCVDLSLSESTGVRQLQLTVERLSNRLTSSNCELNQQKCLYLQKCIRQHETDLSETDKAICLRSEQIRHLLRTPDGQQFMDESLELREEVPWLMATIENWSLNDVMVLYDRVASLVLDTRDPALEVRGFPEPPSDALVSLVSSKAGYNVSIISNTAKLAIATIPIVGSMSGMQQQTAELHEELSKLRLGGKHNMPTTVNHWTIVLRALQKAQAVQAFAEDVWRVYQRRDAWPEISFLSNNNSVHWLRAHIEKAVRVQKIARKLNVDHMIGVAAHCQTLDVKRSLLASRIQSLAEELVNATVLAELSQSFTEEAHSALIRFSQIAGKAKLNKSQLVSKLSQRQRRLRQDYLDAFEKCCRFIPCWILKSSSTCDYLPPEFSLFDLVINDESSLSDITVLPGMLRGKQWLVVGDGKQVSPTEAFVSEDQMDSLRSALPSGPLEASLLPGQSFFDLCAQAFPSGRVVLNEHFRCEANIIEFCNSHFYDDQLVPLRLPRPSERITPSLVDVRVDDGTKVGKTNTKEAEEIVRRVEEMVSDPSSFRRTIGIISLMGDEQSHLIRGLLLDSIGPQLMSRHDVLVGDSPAFQGAERDVIFLSMVCSRGKSPSQNQLFHFQRANVAMSRARDLCVLVRSIDIKDIPCTDDVKVPIIEFFQRRSTFNSEIPHPTLASQSDGRHAAQKLLSKLLAKRGYIVRSMGVVWKNGLCVEHSHSDNRAALMIDCTEETKEEWRSNYRQQKAIERVGWKCLRVGVLSLLTNCNSTIESVVGFLSSAGVAAPVMVSDGIYGGAVILPLDERVNEEQNEFDAADDVHADDDVGDPLERIVPLPEGEEVDDDVVVISSDDEASRNTKWADAKPEAVTSGLNEFVNSKTDKASTHGRVVDLAFLRGVNMD